MTAGWALGNHTVVLLAAPSIHTHTHTRSTHIVINCPAGGHALPQSMHATGVDYLPLWLTFTAGRWVGWLHTDTHLRNKSAWIGTASPDLVQCSSSDRA